MHWLETVYLQVTPHACTDQRPPLFTSLPNPHCVHRPETVPLHVTSHCMHALARDRPSLRPCHWRAFHCMCTLHAWRSLHHVSQSSSESCQRPLPSDLTTQEPVEAVDYAFKSSFGAWKWNESVVPVNTRIVCPKSRFQTRLGFLLIPVSGLNWLRPLIWFQRRVYGGGTDRAKKTNGPDRGTE